MAVLADFRHDLTVLDEEAFVNKHLMDDRVEHVTIENVRRIQEAIALTYGVEMNSVAHWITGSAKLGFAMLEKTSDGIRLPRYRSFGPASDIDVAVVSEPIFERVWNELSQYSYNQPTFPWDAGRLGDYLLCGWLRPDHFPKDARIRSCDDWWDCFRGLSSDPRFGRRTVSGALFYSTRRLREYLGRAVRDCVRAEEITR